MRVLAVRLDSDGDVLLTGPAVRALAHTADAVDLLVSPAGHAAATLLPAVDEVLVFDAPWSGYRPPPVDAAAVHRLVGALRERRYGKAVIFTSFHQSPLPAALLVRLAGIGMVAATSVDYPGSLLDVRHVRPAGHEVTAALDLAHAAGGALPPGDDGRLAIRPVPSFPAPGGPYVAVHPGASVPARALTADHARTIVAALSAAGWDVVVTGSAAERDLCAAATCGAAPDAAPRVSPMTAGTGRAPTPGRVVDLAGRTTLPELAGVLAGAAAVVVGNTGPAHLAAAVGTPVVSLFAPVVSAARWAPFGVPSVLLGDQHAPCRGTRARSCPVPGHPCLSGVAAATVVDAVRTLTADRLTGAVP